MRTSLEQKTKTLRRAAQIFALCAFTLGLTSASFAQTQIKLATLVPSGTSYHHSLLAMGAKWKQSSGGTVSLTIYPDGVQGGEAKTVQKMRVGNVQAAVLTVSGLMEIDPSVAAVQKMPLMFRSLDEAAYVRAKLAPDLDRRLAAKGFVVLFWADAGWVRFFSREPGIGPQDFKKMKIASDTDQFEILSGMGYKPVVLEVSDTIMGLQNGMVDALATVPLHALSGQFYPKTPHMLELNWVPLVGALIVTKTSWDGLPQTQREDILRAAVQCGQEFQNQGRKENLEALEAMKKRGLQVHEVGPEAEKAWIQFAENIYPKVRGRIVPADMFDEVVQILHEYRAGQGGPGK